VHGGALPGGLTNKNYKVSTLGGAFVLRHSSPSSADELAVDRRAEYENSLRAAAAGWARRSSSSFPMTGSW